MNSYSVRGIEMEEMDINELAVLAKNGDERAFNTLLHRMDGAINRIVNKYSVGKGSAYSEEYRQEACCGLYNCLEKYDEEKGAFVSYASYAMRAQVVDFIKNRQNTVSIGTNMLSNVQRVRSAIEAIRENGLEESVENISRISGIGSHKTVETAMWAMIVENTESLDMEVKEGEGTTFADFVECEDGMEEAFLEREKERALYNIVASLPRRGRFIALHSFGIFGAKPMENKEIAEILRYTTNTLVNRKKPLRRE